MVDHRRNSAVVALQRLLCLRHVRGVADPLSVRRCVVSQRDIDGGRSTHASEALSRDQLLALSPRRYLASGYRTEDGATRDELEQLWALAAAEQLRSAGVAMDELERVCGALGRCLRSSATVPADKLYARLDEALESAKPGPALRQLAEAWIEAVRAPSDLMPLVRHLSAVLRTRAMLEALGRKP